MLADLHIHSNVSDGSFSAEDILAQAKSIGLTHIAFTDHDTTELSQAHKALAESYGFFAVTGIEMSAYDYKNNRKVHILGYNYTGTKAIEAIGAETLRKRHTNCLKQIAVLNELGYQVSVEEVAQLAGRCIYKQHILDYLLQSGQSAMLFGDIYQRIFKNGGPCDFDIAYPAVENCIQAIKADGGVAVLAHPGQLDSYAALPRLVDVGLDGIEYNHPSHCEIDKQKVVFLAEKYGLFMTGGSDFHGRYERVAAALGAYPAPENCGTLFA